VITTLLKETQIMKINNKNMIMLFVFSEALTSGLNYFDPDRLWWSCRYAVQILTALTWTCTGWTLHGRHSNIHSIRHYVGCILHKNNAEKHWKYARRTDVQKRNRWSFFHTNRLETIVLWSATGRINAADAKAVILSNSCITQRGVRT